MRPRVAVIAGTRIWPARDGGDLRTAALVEQLATRFDLDVLRPLADSRREHTAPQGINIINLPPNGRAASLGYFARPGPRVGLSLLGAPAREAITRHLATIAPLATLFAHSYLAAVVGARAGHRVTDFPNIESRRFRSIARSARGHHRLSAALEGLKAARWEPRVVRTTNLCLAVTPEDQVFLESWGAQSVVVPNSAPSPVDVRPSPIGGPVTFVGSATYAPNRDGIDYLANDVWPLVADQLPEAVLRIVGRGTAAYCSDLTTRGRIEVLGEVDDVDAYLRASSLVVAPVRSGGGTQLKVLEALAHGRLVVGTPYGATSVPSGLGFAYTAAPDGPTMAKAIVARLASTDERHELEMRLARSRVPDWTAACAPLLGFLEAQATSAHRSPLRLTS